MKRIHFLFTTMIITALFSCSDDPVVNIVPEPDETITMPPKEMRAVWIATVGNIDWPGTKNNAEKQKQEYIDYLEIFQRFNINTVFVQIRPTADAFYPSALEPWSAYLTGTQGAHPGYDPLQFMLEEAHRRNIEFHAWINPYRIATNHRVFVPADNHIYKTHPEWTMKYGDLLLFRPALPEVRTFFTNVVRDIITRYDIDGIHFDDYFYPYPATGVALDDAADYAQYGAGYASIEDFRRGNVNKAIEDIHDLIKTERPGMLFSISPYSVWRHKSKDPAGSDTGGLSNYDDLYADIRLWCEKGWLDIVIPQLYPSTQNINANFIKLASWWPANSFDVPVLIGYGLYRFGVQAEGDVYMNPVELETQFFYAKRQDKILGGVHYNATAFKTNRINILSVLEKEYAEPALVPFMGRATAATPSAVKNLAVDDGRLVWDEVQGTDIRYAVYKVADRKAKLVSVVRNASFVLTEQGDYMVSALNRDNAESPVSPVVRY